MKRSRPRRRDGKVRGEAAVRIHLLRWKSKYRSIDRRRIHPLELGNKEPCVRRHLLDVAVGRDDQENWCVTAQHGCVICRGGRGETGHERGGLIQSGPRRGRFQERAKRQRRGLLEHRRSYRPSGPFELPGLEAARDFSMIADDDHPASIGTRTTLPPRASTVSRPTMASAAQSAPFTRTSG